MKFDQRIDIQGRINKIRLEKVAELPGYFPGNYYTQFVYRDERSNIWWLQRDDMISRDTEITDAELAKNNDLGKNWKDWHVIPSDIITALRKDWEI